MSAPSPEVAASAPPRPERPAAATPVRAGLDCGYSGPQGRVAAAAPEVAASAAPITLTLPVPPSANTYWRHVGGRVLLSREARAYRRTVAEYVLATRTHHLAHGPVSLSFRWYRARKSGDLDNRIKQLLDSLQYAGVLRDDADVAELHAYRDDSDPKNPRVEIALTPAAHTHTPQQGDDDDAG